MDTPILISGHIKHYPWGKLGRDSLVAKLAGKGLELKDRPCAELWFGAHPAGPSLVVNQLPLDLSQLVPDLPYLFKVLSIASPLSIQLHPNIEQAEQLHLQDALHYPDRNHKPELAVAITEVELLHGIRPLNEILKWIALVPELEALLGLENYEQISIKTIFNRLYSQPADEICLACARLKERLAKSANLSLEEQWALRMAKEFPEGDKGVFAFFLLNYARLMPYEAVYTQAGVPHAYLSGDLFECMASSDNVVRAGLTHKFCDEQAMLEIMDYTAKSFAPIKASKTQSGLSYSTEAQEFALNIFSLHTGCLEMGDSPGPELGFVYQGQAVFNGQNLVAGQAILVPANLKSFQLDLAACTFVHVFRPNSL